MNPMIAIITDEPGWHGAQLQAALQLAGYESRFVSLKECQLCTASRGPGIKMPGFEKRLPDGVFVRGVPGGSLEEVIFYLDILHGLEALGVSVYNNTRAIERTVDKAMTSFLLFQAGLPTPAARVVAGFDAAKNHASEELAAGHQLVYKPLFGSQGKGIQRIRTVEDLDSIELVNGIYYLQRFIQSGIPAFSDWRVFVIHGRAIAAMQRVAGGWITNVAQGASCQPALLTLEIRKLAESAIAVLGLPYGGVDLLRNQEGKFQILEVNSIPAWKGLQSVCEMDISSLLIADFLRLCSSSQEQEANVDG